MHFTAKQLRVGFRLDKLHFVHYQLGHQNQCIYCGCNCFKINLKSKVTVTINAMSAYVTHYLLHLPINMVKEA